MLGHGFPQWLMANTNRRLHGITDTDFVHQQDAYLLLCLHLPVYNRLLSSIYFLKVTFLPEILNCWCKVIV